MGLLNYIKGTIKENYDLEDIEDIEDIDDFVYDDEQNTGEEQNADNSRTEDLTGANLKKIIRSMKKKQKHRRKRIKRSVPKKKSRNSAEKQKKKKKSMMSC